jgi:ribosomal-protein-alanine N-acetyltransferase
MITIRLQKVTDAKRFYEILTNPNFIYFDANPKSIEDEKEFLKGNKKRRQDNTDWNYAIIYNNELVGGIGVKINFHRKHIGEIGYFLDEKYWGQGITCQAVKLLEKICFQELGLTRIEILMQPRNKASEKIAIKNKYCKEGLLKKYLKGKDGKMKDCFLYAKTKT